MNSLLGKLCRSMQIMQRARTDLTVLPLCYEGSMLPRPRPLLFKPGGCLGQGLLEPSAARQPTLHVSLAPGASSWTGSPCRVGESLETSEGDASSKETHFIAVWVRLEKGLASSRPSWSSSVEKLGCRDTDPPSTISNKLQFCLDSSLSFSTVDQICSDALYTPDLAPFCFPSPLVPAFVIPLVGGHHLICFLFFYTYIRGAFFLRIENE